MSKSASATKDPDTEKEIAKIRIKPRVPVRPYALLTQKEVEAFLIAFGDDDRPLPETVKILDEIVTEYVFTSVAPSPLISIPELIFLIHVSMGVR